MTSEEIKQFFDAQPKADRLTATTRLFLLALHVNNSLSIGELSEYTGSTPYNVQRLGAKLTKSGLVIRTRERGITKFSLPTKTTTQTHIPTPDTATAATE